MPQMGESIAEGTIVRWIKKVGDKVERDEPLFEISTDKVDAEIPSPVAGVLTEIRHKEGETVPVNSVVAVIGPVGTTAAPGAASAPTPAAAKEQADGSSAPQSATPPAPPAPGRPPSSDAQSTSGLAKTEPPAPARKSDLESTEEAIRQRSSPLVRRIAKEHNIDISQIQGTGMAGRVTKDDILGFLEGGANSGPTPLTPGTTGVGTGPGRSPSPPPAATTRGETDPGRSMPPAATSAKPQSALAGQTVPMSVMRKKIADHMLASRRTSAHVHSAFEVNFHRVAQAREARKAEYERAGAKLTYLSFILKAVVDALRAVPVVNASVEGDSIVYHKQVNVGIAVALDWGLIVPVVKNADEKNLLGLSRAIADLASRARSKQLKPDEVSGGTFTITNPGVFGALFGMPIINQPQVAILGVGAVEKRPVVIEDAIGIRPMAYLTIGYDHRIIDGAVADEFMSHIKRTIENWDPADV
jgi:2-oxoglutarate dehydrogenase E2 component (dihydrolipoamide succinyltransferase)